MITPIDGIQLLRGAMPEQEKTEGTADAQSSAFFGAFQTAIDNVKVADAEKNQAEYLLATGQMDNPAVMTMASTKYQLSVDLLVQLRNKALDAYSELMRISL